MLFRSVSQSRYVSWVGETTGLSAISGFASSLQNAGGGINLANPSFVGPIQPYANAGGSSSFLSDVGGGQIMAGVGTAFNLTNSLKTGKGWGSTVGGALGLWNPLAGFFILFKHDTPNNIFQFSHKNVHLYSCTYHVNHRPFSLIYGKQLYKCQS